MACTTLKTFLCYLRIILDKVIDVIFSLYWNCQKENIPDLDRNHAFLAESASTLAKKIREKELKSEDLVRAVVERIKLVNPIVNAVAEERFVAAIDEARQVDKMIAAGLSEEEARNKPFLGVPFTTKESQAMKNMRLTMGLWARRREVATEDSEGIVRLKAAGAIPVACTNLPELLVWQETRNMVYGMTVNPHHTGRSPGGSSGAEAALTACYATTVSLCSDLGGSTRMPAFYCGLFGHHPTAGTTNLRGVFFRKGDKSDEGSMLTLGFISKHVEDLAPLTKIVAGEQAAQLRLDRNVDIKKINFYYLESSGDCHVSALSSEQKTAMSRVIAKISQDSTSGASSPKPYHHEGFDHMYKLWKHSMTKEPDNFACLCNNGGRPANAYIELIKKFTCLSRHCFFTIMRLLELQVLPRVNAQWAEKLTKELKDDLFSKLGENGVLLLPSAPMVAPYNYSALLRPYNFAYWAIVNALKCPATQVPLGVNSQGLPLGIQVMATPYNDALCLAVAKYLEKEFGGAVMACNIKH